MTWQQMTTNNMGRSWTDYGSGRNINIKIARIFPVSNIHWILKLFQIYPAHIWIPLDNYKVYCYHRHIYHWITGNMNYIKSYTYIYIYTYIHTRLQESLRCWVMVVLPGAVSQNEWLIYIYIYIIYIIYINKYTAWCLSVFLQICCCYFPVICLSD